MLDKMPKFLAAGFLVFALWQAESHAQEATWEQHYRAGLAAYRPDKEGPTLLFVAERGKLEIVGKHPHGKLDLYGESPDDPAGFTKAMVRLMERAL